jgi:hypothetical protein
MNKTKTKPQTKTAATTTETNEPLVSLTIKVKESWRNHWQVEAKRRRTSVTAAIVAALSKEFGLPPAD